MAVEDKIARYMRKTLVNQIRQLSCLLKEDKDSIHSQDYLLASIFNTLSLENKSDASMFCLDLCKLKKLAKNCIKVVESHAIIKFDDSIHSIPTNGGDTHWKPNPELWAMRILVIIIKEFLCQSHTLEILTIIYESLVKKIRVLLRHNYSPDEFGPDMKLTALIAHCLSQYDFRQILTPMEVYKLIRDLVFPLAVWCFTREAVNKKKTFQHFEDNFHGLDVFKDINCGKEYEHTYSHVFRLLHVLTVCSESDALGEYRQKFMTMLNMATKSGHINDELIVATNVIVVEEIRIKASISFLEPILLDLLSKSEGLHRAHIAYFILRLMKPLDGVIGDICDNRPRTKTALAMAMFDNLVTREDELLDEIALRSLTHLLSHPYYLGDYLSTLAVENEARILRKLLEISIKPVAYYQLLEHLDRIKEVQSSIEFDKQAQILITYDIDKLDHLINLWNRDEEQKIQLKDHLKRLANLLRLRRQRLEAGLELRLHKLFDRLTNYEFSEYSTPDYGILLVFPNCFQISRSAWHSIIRILQLEAQTRSHVGPMYGRDKQRSEISNTINTALSHFLMTNASHFYRETGSPEVIELIYGHCKRAVDSGSNKNLLKEILHTWPKEVEMTKLNSSEHRSMLEKFIELLVCELEQARKILESSLTTVDIKRFASALSGLVTAVCRHRETLHSVLDSLDHVERLEDRDSWLRHNISTWIWLIIDSTNQVDCPKKAALGASYHIKEESPEFLEGQFKLDDFSDLVIACEVFVMIREDFHECSELSDSFENLLKVIRSALGRSVGRAPIDSLESKRYQQIKSNLPSE